MNSIETQKQDWSNYWEGRTASQSGEVFGLVEVETSEELTSFWRSVYQKTPAKRIVDLACGAGSVLKHFDASDSRELIGVDISQAALDIAESNVPGLRGVLASAESVPIDDGYADLVVSQFGFEYAGKDLSSEISRLLKPGGFFIAIAHKKNSSIEQECRRNLVDLNAIEEGAFIEKAKTMIGEIIAFERGQSNVKREQLSPRIQDFTDARNKLLPIIQSNQIAAHLYNGTKQLFERRNAYEFKDIEGWLSGMGDEINAYSGRMLSMIKASLTEQEALQLLAEIGAPEDSQLETFTINGDEVGWVLRAKRMQN